MWPPRYCHRENQKARWTQGHGVGSLVSAHRPISFSMLSENASDNPKAPCNRVNHTLNAPSYLMGKCEASRPISTGQLHALLRFHSPPINPVVSRESSGAGQRPRPEGRDKTGHGRPYLGVGFPLRCLQRLSRRNLATLRCTWRHNRDTRGCFVPVLSY